MSGFEVNFGAIVLTVGVFIVGAFAERRYQIIDKTKALIAKIKALKK